MGDRLTSEQSGTFLTLPLPERKRKSERFSPVDSDRTNYQLRFENIRCSLACLGRQVQRSEIFTTDINRSPKAHQITSLLESHCFPSLEFVATFIEGSPYFLGEMGEESRCKATKVTGEEFKVLKMKLIKSEASCIIDNRECSCFYLLNRSLHHPAASTSSQVEGKPVKVDIWGNVADLTAIDGDLVGQHAWGWDLNGVWPVVVIIAESIGEVEDGIFWDKRGILSDVEMSRLDCTLGDWVGHKEEVKSAFDNLWLLDESVVNIGSLRRV